MEWLSTRWRFVRGMQHSWPVRLLWWGWVVLSALSTLSLILPQIRQYIPAWYVWAIGFLLISLVAAVEGGFKQVQMLRGIYDPLKLSLPLFALPVYRQDLEVSISSMCVGTSFGPATIFVELKLWTKSDLNLTKINVSLMIDAESYEVSPLANLRDWILVEQIIDERSSKNSRDTNLASQSLVEEIEAGMFREGHHQPKWIGCELPLSLVGEEQVKAIRIAFQDKHGIARRETFREWPKTSNRVIDAEFRRRS